MYLLLSRDPDEVTLFKGVEAAMARAKKLYFVSTGGGVKGLDNKTFAKFKRMVDGSKYSKRFVFLGWVETADIPYIYSRADVGLNVDRECTETYTGAREHGCGDWDVTGSAPFAICFAALKVVE